MRLVQERDASDAAMVARPRGVPREACWNAVRRQWLLGQSDKNGIPQGMWTFWEADGTLSERAEYVDGRRSGPAWCRMTPGMFVSLEVVAARGRFDNDSPCGRWVLLDRSGAAIEEVDYGPRVRAAG